MNIRCPHCGQDNPEHARFCMHCSGPLVQTCAHCGTTLSYKAQFCSRCGRAVASSARPFVGTGRLPPSTLLAARYRIMRKLGQGGMGAVYLAEDLRLNGKSWAIKEMSDAALIDPAQRQAAVNAFRQEAEMLAKLDHVNLPRVSDYFSEGSNQYLVMEYVQGQTLEEMLAQSNAPLPEKQVTSWANQLCTVLTYLHNQQPSPIIFRDLKPGNIMVRNDGVIKLIDFGIARHFKPGQNKDTQAFGTVGYASPEQHGKGQTDVRSDIYSLGATLHHLLTGHDPAIMPFSFERVRKLNSAISRTVDEAIAKAVEMKPEQRWQNMEELRRTLTGGLPNPSKPVIPQSQPSPPPSMPNPGTHSRFATGLMIVGIGIILFIVLSLVFANQKPQSAATINISAAVAQATTTARAGAQATATLRARSTATAVARIQASATQQARFTAIAIAKATATWQAVTLAINVLKSQATPVAGPSVGDLEHDATSDSIEFYEITQTLRNFVTEVRFYNPYRRTENGWDYGFGFRDLGSNRQYRLFAQSDGTWEFYLIDGNTNIAPIASGQISNLDLTGDGSNFLQLWVDGEKAHFFVNQEYVATLDVSKKVVAGTIWIGTGFLTDHKQSGATTHYEEFGVWSLPG